MKIQLTKIFLFTNILLVTSLDTLASRNLDRKFKLETIGLLRSADNIDGVLSDYISTQYEHFFNYNDRFTFTDLSSINSILESSKIPYQKLVQDPDVLRQLSKVAKIESLIRTQVTQYGSEYLFILDWIQTPDIHLIATEQFTVPTLQMELIAETFRQHMQNLLNQVPFVGQVTGRDNEWITVNIGRNAGVRPNDTFLLSTLDDVQKHPISKQIVHWKLSPTGKIIAEQVEESMTFCKILQEDQKEPIAQYQKITQIQHQPDPLLSVLDEKKEKKESRPQMGWLSVGPSVGSHNWQFSSTSNAISNTGGGINFGAQVNSQLSLSQKWFLNANLGYSFLNFYQKDFISGFASAASQNGGVIGSLFSYQAKLGYSQPLFENDWFGPKGSLTLGYKSNAILLPYSSSENTGPVYFRSVLLGMEADCPLLLHWGASMSFDFRLFSWVDSLLINDTLNTASDVSAALGVYYFVHSKIRTQAAIRLSAMNAHFSSGTSVNQLNISINPSILYHF